MRRSLLCLPLTLLLALAPLSAWASSITFGGILAPGSNLGTATSLDFTAPTFVTSVSGDLASFVSVPDVASFSDFTFAPFSAVDPLWSVGGYSFKLSDITISSQTANGLVLIGSGLINGNTLVDSPFDFSFSADSVRGILAFSATNAATPEPGTLLLLGSGLVALGLQFRRRHYI